MEVKIYRASLTIEGRKERLTKSMAKQLPIQPWGDRWRAAEKGEPQPEPICKVSGHVLEQMFDWMYLVEDPIAGLGWVAAMQPNEKYAKAIIERGGWVDHPEDVPTVIL